MRSLQIMLNTGRYVRVGTRVVMARQPFCGERGTTKNPRSLLPSYLTLCPFIHDKRKTLM